MIFLAGEKTSLRPMERDDLKRCRRWINSPDVRAGVDRRLPMTELDEENWFESLGWDSASPANMVFAIIENEPNHHVGNIGLHEIDWISRNAIFGILIGDSDQRHKGFAGSASRLLLRYAFMELGLHRINSMVISNNKASLKLHRSLGFVEEGRQRDGVFHHGQWLDWVMFGMLAGDFTG